MDLCSPVLIAVLGCSAVSVTLIVRMLWQWVALRALAVSAMFVLLGLLMSVSSTNSIHWGGSFVSYGR